MTGRLENKVVIVTGSTQGIGRAIARLFVAEGAQVVLNSAHDDEHARAVRAELTGPSTLYLQADVSDPVQVEAMVARTLAHFGRVDVLINNAGVNVFADPLALTARSGGAASRSTSTAPGTSRARCCPPCWSAAPAIS
jgi:NAD(P)-dependent dehydrogenase (short-subunit alcohol dehydrogenase family)